MSKTSPFLFTLFATQALKAIGRRSIFSSVFIWGIKLATSNKLASAKCLSFSSETKGLIEELKIVVNLGGEENITKTLF